LSGTQTASTTTNSSGAYSFTVQGDGDYTVTPSLGGYAFGPPATTVDSIRADQVIDFSAIVNMTAIWTNLTHPDEKSFHVGDQASLKVTGLPHQQVWNRIVYTDEVDSEVRDWDVIGETDDSGEYENAGPIPASWLRTTINIGSWSHEWKVGSIDGPPTAFSVVCPNCPTITSIDKSEINGGAITDVTIRGHNLFAPATIVSELSSAQVIAYDDDDDGVAGTSLKVRIDATSASENVFYSISVKTWLVATQQYATTPDPVTIRVISPGPVVDLQTPSKIPMNASYVVSIVGKHLGGVEVVAGSQSLIRITDVEVSENNDHIRAVLRSFGQEGTAQIRVTYLNYPPLFRDIVVSGTKAYDKNLMAKAAGGSMRPLYLQEYKIVTRNRKQEFAEKSLPLGSVRMSYDIKLMDFSYAYALMYCQDPADPNNAIYGSDCLLGRALGETIPVNSYVVSLYLRIDMTVFWDVYYYWDWPYIGFGWPGVCFKILAAFEYPGWTGTGVYQPCYERGVGKGWYVNDKYWRFGRQPSISHESTGCVDIAEEGPVVDGLRSANLELSDCAPCFVNAVVNGRAFEGLALWIQGEGSRDLAQDFYFTAPVAEVDPMYPTPVVGCRDTDPAKPKIEKPLGSLDVNPNDKKSFLLKPLFDGKPLDNSEPYHFDFLGVVDDGKLPNRYALKFKGKIGGPLKYGYEWTLEPGAGTIRPDTANKKDPTHIPPETVPPEGSTGILTLTATDGGNPVCSVSKKIKIYSDHLERDYETFYQFSTGSHKSLDWWKFTSFNAANIQMYNTWNCHGSVMHAYNGSGIGSYGEVKNGKLYLGEEWKNNATEEHLYPIDEATWTRIEDSLSRGDVVSFYSGNQGNYTLEHSHTALGKPDHLMFGANNEPTIDFSKSWPNQATWMWAVCKSKDYFNNINAAALAKWKKILLTRIVIHKKPNAAN
jgi:hypothetical protein